MRKYRNPTPADYRQLDRLVWKAGGPYDGSLKGRWEPSMPAFFHHRKHSFKALGHTWTLSFSTSVWRYCLDASISIMAEDLLDPEETQRIRSTGFYDDLTALFGEMGYGKPWISPRANGEFTRYLASVAEIAPLQRKFEALDLSSPRPERRLRLKQTQKRRQIDALLAWGRKQDRKHWKICCLELRATSIEAAAGLRWKTRRDVVLAPISGCSWLFAWPPRRFSRADWRRIERTGYFQRSDRRLKRLGQQGRWRADLFHDPDRLAAEFWKQARDPVEAWRDFKALLDYRLS